ncbi:hypothetical protein ACFL1H_07580 [Nanoarchaeota archaeon]
MKGDKSKRVVRRYDLSKKSSGKKNSKPSKELLNKIEDEQFEKGKHNASFYIQRVLSCNYQFQAGVDQERVIRRLMRINNDDWYFNKQKILIIHGEEGISRGRLDVAKEAVEKYICNRFDIYFNININKNSSLFNLIEGNPIPKSLELRKIVRNYNISPIPTGHLLITNRDVEGGLGFAGPAFALVRDCDSLDLMVGHEMMHYMDLEEQSYTKDSGNNCRNKCLMNYMPFESNGELCIECNTGANAYRNGVNDVLKQYGWTLKDI